MPNDPWLSLLWVVICVAAIVALAYWFTRYVAARGLPGGFGAGGAERFKVLSRLALSKDTAVALVQVGERFFLLGIAPTGVSNLAELTAQEAEHWTDKQTAEQTPPPSFREALRTVIRQKKQR